MKYGQKMNRQEKRVMQSQILKESLEGTGVYLFENNTDADLTLPRPTQSGRREIGPREQFQGDNYYLKLMSDGLIRLIEVIQTPEQQEAAMQKEEEKLILDQPETVTSEGTVENVSPAPTQPCCNEGDGTPCCGGEQPAVLLNEGPADDGFVIVEE